MAVLGLVLTYWITEAIPIPAAALLGVTLAVLLGVASLGDALAPFSDPIVFLFIGSFMLAQAMAVHGLDRRVAVRLLTLPGANGEPLRMLFAFGLGAGFLSV